MFSVDLGCKKTIKAILGLTEVESHNNSSDYYLRKRLTVAYQYKCDSSLMQYPKIISQTKTLDL